MLSSWWIWCYLLYCDFRKSQKRCTCTLEIMERIKCGTTSFRSGFKWYNKSSNKPNTWIISFHFIIKSLFLNDPFVAKINDHDHPISYHQHQYHFKAPHFLYLGLKKCQPKKKTPTIAQTQPITIQAMPMNGFLSPKKEVPVSTMDFVPPYWVIS